MAASGQFNRAALLCHAMLTTIIGDVFPIDGQQRAIVGLG